jgi:hypothetical protein
MFDRLTSDSRIGTSLAVLGTVLMLISVAAPAMAAAPTVDTETTDTSTTSDWTDGHTVTQFNASADANSWIEASYDSQNASVEIADNETGEVHLTNSSMEQTAAIDSSGDGSTDTWYYAWNLSHDEMDQIPMDAEESKTLDVTFINDSAMDNPDTTTIQVTLNNTDERAVVFVGDTFTNDSNNFETETVQTAFGIEVLAFGDFGSESTMADIQQDNVAVNGSQTTLTLALAESNATDAFSAAAEDTEAGDFIRSQQVFVDGAPVPVYDSEAPDSANTTGTYGVYDAGTDEVVVHLGDEHESKSAVDVHAVGNDAYSFSDRFDMFGLSAFMPFSLLGGLGFGMFGAGLFITGRPEPAA